MSVKSYLFLLVVLLGLQAVAKVIGSPVYVSKAKMNLIGDDDFNFNSSEAILQWVKSSGKIQALYASSQFQYGIPIALHQILNRGDKWILAKAVDYKYFLASPLIEKPLLINQNPKIIKKIPINAYYFIYLKANPQARLVVNTKEAWASGEVSADIYYSDANGTQTVVAELSKDIENELKLRSGFKGGILEFKAAGSLGFLMNIESYKLNWDQIILNEDVKQKLIEGIDGFLKNYNYNEWKKIGIPMSQGLLVYGPPGTGKTLLGKVIISNILKKYYPQIITYIHVQSRHIDSLESIRMIFQKARELSPSVIFFEDIDLIAGTDRTDRAQIKNELMQQLSGIEELNGVLTIGTTNVEDKIDAALKRSKRLGLHYLFGLPIYSERVQLFKILCKNPNASQLKFDHYANETEGLTGADIKQVCQSAIDLAIAEKIKSEGKELILTHEIILQSIALRKKTRLTPDRH